MPLNSSAPFGSHTSSPIGRAGTNSNSGNVIFEVAPLMRCETHFFFSAAVLFGRGTRQCISAQQTCLLSSLNATTGDQTPRLFSCCCCASSVRNRTTHIRRVVLVDSVRTHGTGGRYRSASRFVEIWLIFRARISCEMMSSRPKLNSRALETIR